MIIWEESYLQTLLEDAERAVVNELDYIFFRFSIATEVGRSTYSLPRFTRKITRVTYQGFKVWPVSVREMDEMYPATAVVSQATKVEPPVSRPRFWCNDRADQFSIRFYPAPNLAIAADDSDLFGKGADSRVVISCWRAPNPENPLLVLPTYVGRRLRKYWALSKAFEKEGKGQNLKAAVYFKGRYENAIALFRDINNGVFTAKKQRLSELYNIRGMKPHRPILPPNYGPTL